MSTADNDATPPPLFFNWHSLEAGFGGLIDDEDGV